MDAIDNLDLGMTVIPSSRLLSDFSYSRNLASHRMVLSDQSTLVSHAESRGSLDCAYDCKARERETGDTGREAQLCGTGDSLLTFEIPMTADTMEAVEPSNPSNPVIQGPSLLLAGRGMHTRELNCDVERQDTTRASDTGNGMDVVVMVMVMVIVPATDTATASLTSMQRRDE
ncbi:hypothetical protein O1611_g10604 [Lasiodiplodia mahajangana]|uniref:Uncharacterized protein n=1 Tax=Lasiodiplodia mahajangana TaxID=1108764 RepID=A0ACC2IWI7_9PEZI|nr:hypothetical protein O1611_g10604 [Lasiodiplodia mahajangana]